MTPSPQAEQPDRDTSGAVLRPEMWRPRERHVLIGVSHPSNDPARHRIFEVRASYDAAAEGWVARAAEQDMNEQRGDWALVTGDDPPVAFPTAAECLGHAVTTLVAAVDEDADDGP